MPDIQEAKCYEFTVRILPPPLVAPRGGQKKILRFAQILPPPRFISVYALGINKILASAQTKNRSTLLPLIRYVEM